MLFFSPTGRRVRGTPRSPGSQGGKRSPGAKRSPGVERRRHRVLAAVLGTVAVLATMSVLYFSGNPLNKITPQPGLAKPFPPEASRPTPSASPGLPDAPLNFLVIGSNQSGAAALTNVDGSGYPASPSPGPVQFPLASAPAPSPSVPTSPVTADLILLVHISADRKSISSLVVPSDTALDVPGTGPLTLTDAIRRGGIGSGTLAIESLIGVRVDHVVVVDFRGLSAVTDAVGGIVASARQPFKSALDPGVEFAAGWQTLNGRQLAGFLDPADNVPDRADLVEYNQVVVIRQIFKAVLRVNPVFEAGRLADIVSGLSPYIRADDALLSSNLVGLYAAIHAVNESNDLVAALPVTSAVTTDAGSAGVRPDPNVVAQIRLGFRQDTLARYLPTMPYAADRG